MIRKQFGTNNGFTSGFALSIVMVGLVALIGGSAAAAQDATPEPDLEVEVAVPILTPDDGQIGTASFVELDQRVMITVQVDSLTAGEHGIHIHETGVCDPAGDEPYSSAGGHFNPTGVSHGPGPVTEATPVATSTDATPLVGTPAAGDVESHAGDLGNITIAEDGTGFLELSTDRITLTLDAENSLNDDDGSALVIHEDPDDLMTDPSGESGARVACAVIFPPFGGTPVASPAASGGAAAVG